MLSTSVLHKLESASVSNVACELIVCTIQLRRGTACCHGWLTLGKLVDSEGISPRFCSRFFSGFYEFSNALWGEHMGRYYVWTGQKPDSSCRVDPLLRTDIPVSLRQCSSYYYISVLRLPPGCYCVFLAPVLGFQAHVSLDCCCFKVFSVKGTKPLLFGS